MVKRSEYELIVIAHPQLGDDEEGLPALMARLQGWIEGVGGELSYDDIWGRRRLAYPIRKQTEGTYLLLRAWMPHNSIVELEREMKLADDILRYLLVRAETPPPPKRAAVVKPVVEPTPEPAEEAEPEAEAEAESAAEVEVEAEVEAADEPETEADEADGDDDVETAEASDEASDEGADEGSDEASDEGADEAEEE